MKVIIYSHVQLWPVHHAETLELALKHLDCGDEVFLLTCEGDLSTCPANAEHDLSKCGNCKKQTDYSVQQVLEGRVKKIRLNLERNANYNKKFKDINDLRSYVEDGVPLGALVVSQLVSVHRDCFFDVAPYANEIDKLISDGRALYQQARMVIKENKIDKVYVWNGRRICDGPVCYAARDEGVELEVYISGGKRGTYLTLPALTVMNLDAHNYRILKLFELISSHQEYEEIKNEAADFYKIQRYGGGDFPGYVQFSKNFEKTNLNFGNKKNIVVFSSAFWEFFSLDEYAHGMYTNHYSGIKQIISDDRITARYNVIVRWHPNLRNCGFFERKVIDEVINTKSEGVLHYPPESDIDSYQLCEQADIVISFGSTIGVEASYYGKPSILLGRSWYEETGACYRPKSHSDLVRLLSGDLKPLPQLGAMVYGYYFRNYGNNIFKYLELDEANTFSFRGKSIFEITVGDKVKRWVKGFIPNKFIRMARNWRMTPLLKRFRN